MYDQLRSSFLSQCRKLGIHPDPRILDCLHMNSGEYRNITSQDKPRTSPVPPILNLSGQALDLHSINALSNVLQGYSDSSSFFNSILLSDALINDEGTVSICKSLKTNRFTSICYLDLRGNNIQVEGGLAIGSFLKHTNSLISLILEWNSIGLWDHAMRAISEGLGVNQSLQYLDFRNNKINSVGITSLSEWGLKLNKCLTNLDLGWNNAGHLGGQSLIGCLRYNRTITHINLLGNDLDQSVLDTIQLALDRNLRHTIEANNLVRMHDNIHTLQQDHIKEIDSLNQQLTAKDTDIDSLKLQLNKAHLNMRTIQNQCKEMERDRDSALERYNNLEMKLAQQESSHESIVGDLQTKIGSWKSKAVDFQHQLNSSVDETERMQADFKTKLKQQIESVQKQAELDSQFKLDILTKQHQTERTNIQSTLESCVSQLQAKLDKSRQMNEAKQSELDALIKSHNLELNKLRNSLDFAEQQSSSLKHQCSRLESKLEAQKADVDAKVHELSTLQSEYSNLDMKSKNTNSKIHLDHLNEMSQLKLTYTRQIDQLTSNLNLLQKDFDLLQNEKAVAVHDAKVLFNDREQLRLTNENLTNELNAANLKLMNMESFDERRRLSELNRISNLQSALGTYLTGAKSDLACTSASAVGSHLTSSPIRKPMGSSAI